MDKEFETLFGVVCREKMPFDKDCDFTREELLVWERLEDVASRNPIVSILSLGMVISLPLEMIRDAICVLAKKKILTFIDAHQYATGERTPEHRLVYRSWGGMNG